jgi:hypothetical protein
MPGRAKRAYYKAWPGHVVPARRAANQAQAQHGACFMTAQACLVSCRPCSCRAKSHGPRAASFSAGQICTYTPNVSVWVDILFTKFEQIDTALLLDYLVSEWCCRFQLPWIQTSSAGTPSLLLDHHKRERERSQAVVWVAACCRWRIRWKNINNPTVNQHVYRLTVFKIRSTFYHSFSKLTWFHVTKWDYL